MRIRYTYVFYSLPIITLLVLLLSIFFFGDNTPEGVVDNPTEIVAELKEDPLSDHLCWVSRALGTGLWSHGQCFLRGVPRMGDAKKSIADWNVCLNIIILGSPVTGA